MKNDKKTALIIGAGPAGLTAAYELLKRTDILPIVFEADSIVGGISKTVYYKGNRIDIGGHRFFSKSDRVTDWWLNLMPLKDLDSDNSSPDDAMLIRQRLSRIFFRRRFFRYPVSLSFSTIRNLGIVRLVKIMAGYLWIRLFPVKEEKTLEDLFINRFGKALYRTFFRDYTEKVWGVECRQISAEWGLQRIKGMSVSRAFVFALKRIFSFSSPNIRQKKTETSLIEKFMYPVHGPGQLWEKAAAEVVKMGGTILLNSKVTGISMNNKRVTGVHTSDGSYYPAHYILSTMPVKYLISALQCNVPEKVRKTADGLVYRDFITAGLLLNRLQITDKGKPIRDNWIYIQESDVKAGRLQIFNNWSPFMVADQGKTWIGVEYFCNEGDELWKMTEAAFLEYAAGELEKIGFIRKQDVLDGIQIKSLKTYPAYFGSYDEFHHIRDFTDKIENLFLIGRNGMHRYNNQDHSMLTAMISVDIIASGETNKDMIWQVNTEEEYHEERND
ncbi:MAG: NAD(P)/FAD-dependent oxidoreductase [Bacteroidota bacterium]